MVEILTGRRTITGVAADPRINSSPAAVSHAVGLFKDAYESITRQEGWSPDLDLMVSILGPADEEIITAISDGEQSKTQVTVAWESR